MVVLDRGYSLSYFGFCFAGLSVQSPAEAAIAASQRVGFVSFSTVTDVAV